MVEFQTMGEYGPMDREYHEAISEVPQEARVEDPIFTIDQLGETVPEQDPTGRFKNIIQTTQAAIRGGSGTIQLVMMTPPESPLGGRPKSYGKEVRQTLREVALANNVNIAGLEMPTALNNMSGFDHQQLTFSDDKRKTNLDEVKDAIKFIADVGMGGGVDIVSWEFPRGVNEAAWQPELEKDQVFKQVGEQRIGWLVDDRNGRTIQFRKDEVLHLPYKKEGDFGPIEVTPAMLAKPKELLELNDFQWDDFKKWAKRNEELNKQKAIDPETEKPRDDRPEKAEVLYIHKQLDGQITTLDGWRTTYADRARSVDEQRREFEEAVDTGIEKYRDPMTGETKERDLSDTKRQDMENAIPRLKEEYKDYLHSAQGQMQQAQELRERKKHLQPIREYALGKSTETYAEAGIAAMREYEVGRQKGTVTKPLYVGPEIGWPGYFGSHPTEFIELITDSRKEMVHLLTSPKIDKMQPWGEKEKVKNDYYDPSLSKKQAEELAEKHVKGLFDTSHMGMWLAHFKPEKDPNTGILETEERRIKRFNKWYEKEVTKIAEAGVIGGVQLVDSMSAAHGHLPPGEGIFPVKATAEILKSKGFKGFMVSEGHEEEKFGEGRIRSKTWQMAGAEVGAGYFSGPPLQWQQTQHGYFGKTYSPQFMFGGYSPSNEFKLWSEVPLE